jgi:hypothetical protein
MVKLGMTRSFAEEANLERRSRKAETEVALGLDEAALFKRANGST